jgi:hypothetical protein
MPLRREGEAANKVELRRNKKAQNTGAERDDQMIKTKKKLDFHQHNANGTGGVSSKNPPDPH